MTETPQNNRPVRRLASSSSASTDPLLGGLFNFVDRDDLVKVGSTHHPNHSPMFEHLQGPAAL